MVIPVIAIAALEYPDYSPFLVGLAIGGYGLTQAILQIPMGLMSDRWGRKPVIYLGLCLFALGSLIAGLADSMWLLTIGRILQGAGAIAGAVMALATDVTRESQRTKVMRQNDAAKSRASHFDAVKRRDEMTTWQNGAARKATAK